MNMMPKQEVCDNVPISIPMLSFDSLIADMKKMKSISNEKLLALQSRLEAAENETKMLREENEILKSSLQAKERECKFYYNQNQIKASSLVDNKTIDSKTSKNENDPELDENQGDIIAFDDTDSTLAQSNVTKTSTKKKERPIAKARKRPWSEISGWKSDGTQSKTANPTHFQCTFCPNSSHSLTSFETIEKYRSHIYEIHPERKFVCNSCPYTCKLNKHLIRHHRLVHTGVHDLGYNCKLCNLSFASSRCLANHFNLYH